MKRLGLTAVALATAAVIAVSYIGWSAPMAGVAEDRGSRSHAFAARELPRLISRYEDRLSAQPNADDFAFLGQLYLQRGRQTGDLQTYLQAEHAVNQALAIEPSSEGAQLE